MACMHRPTVRPGRQLPFRPTTRQRTVCTVPTVRPRRQLPSRPTTRQRIVCNVSTVLPRRQTSYRLTTPRRTESNVSTVPPRRWPFTMRQIRVANVSLNKLHVPQTTSAKRTTKTLRRPRAADRYVPFPPGGLCPPGSPHDRYLVLGLAVSVDTVYLVTIYLTQCTWKRSADRVYLATIYGNCCLCLSYAHGACPFLPLPPTASCQPIITSLNKTQVTAVLT